MNVRKKGYFNFFLKSSRIWRAVSFPPRPNAMPPAIATMATNPVNRILIKSTATPN